MLNQPRFLLSSKKRKKSPNKANRQNRSFLMEWPAYTLHRPL
nr:MAG TPA_asm: hypothetical protein [Caudoviricetes sp.]